MPNWNTVPEDIENDQIPFSNDSKIALEVEETAHQIKDQIKRELEKPRFICDTWKARFSIQGNKLRHKATHVCKKVKLKIGLLILFCNYFFFTPTN